MRHGDSFYEKLRKQGTTVRKYPNGDDPKKIKLFGEFKTCLKCGEKKHIFNFHFKNRTKRDGTKRPDVQAQCGACRVEQKIKKYNSDPHSHIFRLIQLLSQPSSQKRGRKPCNMEKDEFMNEWQKQYEVTGLYCPKLGIQMTHVAGKSKVKTNISIDRINGKKNYQIGNVQFVSYIYNIMKQHYTDEEVDEFCLLRVNVIKKLENGQEMFVKGQW